MCRSQGLSLHSVALLPGSLHGALPVHFYEEQEDGISVRERLMSCLWLQKSENFRYVSILSENQNIS